MTDVVKPSGSASPPTAPSGGGAGLRRNILSMPEVLTQSVANAAPSAAVSVLPAIAFIYAGNGAWLTFVIAIVALVLIGYSVSIFARRFASAGSFYVYNAKALGPAGGFASGWALVLGYVFTAMATTCGVAIYLGAFLTQIGLPGGTTVAVLLMIAVDVIIATWFAYRDIGLSARVSLVLEAVSMTIILVLFAIVFVRKGHLDGRTDPQGHADRRDRPGIVIAIFAFVGFESAASLGLEAKNPYRSVPRSVIISAVLVGVVLHHRHPGPDHRVRGRQDRVRQGPGAAVRPRRADGSVLDRLRDEPRHHGQQLRLHAGLHQRRLPDPLPDGPGRHDPQLGRAFAHQQPDAAHRHLPGRAADGARPFVIILSGHGPLDVINWMGTTATFGFMLAYLLVAIAAPLYLYRQGSPIWLHWRRASSAGW